MHSPTKNFLSHIQKQLLERELGMEGGYVLSFSNRTFAEFFREIIGVDIYSEVYELGSGSKANRMRAFWNVATNDQLILLFKGLIEAWGLYAPHQIGESALGLLQSLIKDAEKRRANDVGSLSSIAPSSFFHLLVSSSGRDWDGVTASLPLSRCLNALEGTRPHLVASFGDFTQPQIAQLIQIPAVFACETPFGIDARVGELRKIRVEQEIVHIEFLLQETYPSIPNEILARLKEELDIEDFEFYRGHWAIKGRGIGEKLIQEGFPPLPMSSQPLINIRSHFFQVALSFPGEQRPYVQSVANYLAKVIGHNTVFYDNFYKSQLAAPNLDTALQDLYLKRAMLTVVFLSKDYASKKWCGIEFRAIKEIIAAKRDENIMFVRMDDADVKGVFSNDGYIDANHHTPVELGSFIYERVKLLRNEGAWPG